MNINNFTGGGLIFLGLVFLSITLYNLGINSIVKKANKKSPEVKFRYKRLVRDVFYSSIFNTSTILLLYIILTFLLLVFAFFKIDAEDENFIISISSIFSSLLILITLVMTNNQNRKNNDNFEKAQKESKEQFGREREETQAQFIEQQKFLQRQQFESTFFNMMNQLEDIVSKLSLEDKRGRDVFEYFYTKHRVYVTDYYINSFHKNIPDKESKFPNIGLHLFDSEKKFFVSAKGIKNIINDLGISGYENITTIHILDHYFRYLYRIMKFVNEADYLDSNKQYIDERYKYMGILRATLSPYELVLLFYNDLSKYGKEKVKPLIEKYSMFKSLRPELLANSKRDYELNLIEDCYKNDFDRYISFDRKDSGYLRYDQSVISKEYNTHLLNK